MATLSSSPPSPPDLNFKAAFDRDGYVVVPDLVSSLTEYDALLAAAQRVIAKTRSGEWPHRRVVGRQFPPFDADNPDSWGVQHVMHPELGEKVFAGWYTGERVVGAVRTLVGCAEREVQMGEYELK